MNGTKQESVVNCVAESILHKCALAVAADKCLKDKRNRHFEASWRSGDAADCKSVVKAPENKRLSVRKTAGTPREQSGKVWRRNFSKEIGDG